MEDAPSFPRSKQIEGKLALWDRITCNRRIEEHLPLSDFMSDRRNVGRSLDVKFKTSSPL